MAKSVSLICALCATALLVGAVSQTASAQPLHAQPASVMIFPLFNSMEANNTLITVTNTNEDERLCPSQNGFRRGDVQCHFIYFSEEWAQSDTDEDLTPADTLTVLARGHNPNFETGFLVVEARDPETNIPIDFDNLIGSAIVVNSEFDFQWSYTPYAFLAISPQSADPCNPFIDLPGDADFDQLDFNGVEYSTFPEFLLIDHFFGEGTPDGLPNVSFSNTLFLMSTSPGGDEIADMTDVEVQGFNNNERGFSRSFRFNCYITTTLNEVTGATTQAALANDGDAGELNGVAYGWLRLRTRNVRDHALLGVFVHVADIGGDNFIAGRECQYRGSRLADLPRGF